MLLDVSRDNVRALVSDAAVEDTHNINRTAFRLARSAPRGSYPTRYTWIPIGLEFLIAAFLLAGAVGIGLAFLEHVAPSALRGPVRALRVAFLEPVTRPTWLWMGVALVGLFHPQSLGMGMDLIVAAFPALYALAWVCAHEPKRTRIAAALLVSAHVAFWVIAVDPQFVNQVID